MVGLKSSLEKYIKKVWKYLFNISRLFYVVIFFYRRDKQLSSSVIGRIGLQGTPQASQPAGISFVTTLPAPITAPSPIVTPPQMMAPQAIQTWFPIVMDGAYSDIETCPSG